MKQLLHIAFALLALPAMAQVEVDVPIQFTGADDLRGVDGLADPTQGSSAITVGFAVRGSAHWCSATVEADTLELQIEPVISNLNNGLLLRFAAPTDLHGPLRIRLGTQALPLLRPDGLAPIRGQVRSGNICEVLHADGTWTLLAPELRGCPSGTLQVHERLCVDVNERAGLSFQQAASYCNAQGGKLCRWDEYYAACTLLQDQLADLFDNWEWIDDTSNHTQTADQAGLGDCAAQRSASPLNSFSARCCYQPR